MSDSQNKMGAGGMVIIAVLALLLFGTLLWAVTTWNAAAGVEMSVHGWIALALGTFFSLAIGSGLMALMFFSSRSGHDDLADPLRKNKPPADQSGR